MKPFRRTNRKSAPTSTPATGLPKAKPGPADGSASSPTEFTQADILSFIGIRRIVGDPGGKLMQDEIAARIQSLTNLLREVVGLLDATGIMLETLPKDTPRRNAVVFCHESVKDVLEAAIPDYDSICQAIHAANPQEPG